MNARRPSSLLFKVWAALSVCWVGGWSWYYHLDSCRSLHAGEDTAIGWHCDGPAEATGGHEMVPLLVMMAVVVGLPLAVLLAGIALRLLASVKSSEAEGQDAKPSSKSTPSQ